MDKYNNTITRSYKNADVEMVIEDDLITTTRIFIGGECVSTAFISTEKNPDGIPYNRRNSDAVFESCKEEIDAMWEETIQHIAARYLKYRQ